MRILRQVLMLQDMKTENSFIILIVVPDLYLESQNNQK